MGAVFLAPLYLLMNLYLAVRILLWLRIVGEPVGSTWFVAVFLVLFLAATISPLPAAFAQGRAKRIANRISNYWLGILMYLLIFLLLSDVVWGVFCLIAHRPLLSIFGTPAPTMHEVWLFLSARSSADWQQNGTFPIYLWGGAVVLAATAGSFIWGIVHAHCVHKVTYPVSIHKECNLAASANREAVPKLRARPAAERQRGGVSTAPVLKIALVADLHLGYSVGLDRVQEVVRIINDMKPDLVIFAGGPV